jgi:hypothetical protein
MSYRSILAEDLERLERVTTATWGMVKLELYGDAAEIAQSQLEAIFDAIRTIDEVAASM